MDVFYYYFIWFILLIWFLILYRFLQLTSVDWLHNYSIRIDWIELIEFVVVGYLCGCRCASSCLIFGGIACRSIGTGTAGCPSESINASIASTTAWTSCRTGDIRTPSPYCAATCSYHFKFSHYFLILLSCITIRLLGCRPIASGSRPR